MWMLTDFTEDNGPTRVVPRSHRSGKHPQDVMEAPEEAHPDEIKLIGAAGTVVVFNSHLWHGATLNPAITTAQTLPVFGVAATTRMWTDPRRIGVFSIQKPFPVSVKRRDAYLIMIVEPFLASGLCGKQIHADKSRGR